LTAKKQTGAAAMIKTDVFLDTNILIYAFSDDEAKARTSTALLENGGIISVQVLNEFASASRGKHKQPWPQVQSALTTIRSLVSVVPLTTDTHVFGLYVAERYQLSVYDSMIVAAALLAGCTTLYSEDMHHGLVIDGLKIVNPFRG
jgi:predicted nucleic acid-binding protein